MVKYFLIILLFPHPLYSNSYKIVPNQTQESINTTIQNAKPHDTIIFQDGIFHIQNLIISKPLTLVGTHKAVLDGSGKYEIMIISGDSIQVLGLTFKNSGYSSMNDYASIKIINSKHITIENNNIFDAFFAIHISNSSYCTIKGNRIEGRSISEQLNGNAIHAWKSKYLNIANNTLSRHRDGIYLEFVTHSSITGNHSTQQMRYGLHFMFSNDDSYTGNFFSQNGAGVAVMYSKKVVMKNNKFTKNWGPSAYGLLLKDISDSEIENNVFEENTKGIYMEGSNRIKNEYNVFKENGWGIVLQANCSDNSFTYNNFISNSFDVSTNGRLTLNMFDHNYWDEYEGYDLNKDGIGDVSYHPLSFFSVLLEQNQSFLIFIKSFMMTLFDKMERAIPSLTSDEFIDQNPSMRPVHL